MHLTYNSFPLNQISDREFEVLCYFLFKERIKYNDINLDGKFDKINLMAGVAEKGFDSTLYLKGKIVGLLQCKQYKNRLTKPQFLKEYLKFILHAILSPEIVIDKDKFTYFIIASSGYANTTLNFIPKIKNEIIRDEILKICLQLKADFKSLNKFDETKLDEVIDIAGSITVVNIIPEDINQYLTEYINITKSFFRIFTATDNTLIENVISTYLAPLLKSVQNDTIEIKDYQFRFKEYLLNVLDRYSSASTLVFGNQQKKIEDFYYPLTLTCLKETSSRTKIRTHKYTDDFIPKYKKVLICDHGGMGKSTILKWLFRSSAIQNKGIPIFIELRTLNKDNSLLEAITKQLEPIDIKLEKSITRNLIAKGNFIFFLDGYDEIANINKKEVTRDLQDFISKANKNFFIISSRPEDAIKTFGDFQEFSIDRLKVEESYELIKKIGNNNTKSIQLVELLKKEKKIEFNDFLQSPLLTSLLYKKFEHRETIPLKKQEFYWEVFEALFQAHDIIKGDRFEREKESGLSLHDFHKILRGIGYFTAIMNQIEYSFTELEKFIKHSNNFFPGLEFSVNSFINDIISNVPILQKEGVRYKWAHKTLQEYFAAEFICHDTKENQESILKRLIHDNNSKSYYGILDMCYEIDYKSFRKHIIYPRCLEYIQYYNNSILKFSDYPKFQEIRNIAYNLFFYQYIILPTDAESFDIFIVNMDEIITKLFNKSLFKSKGYMLLQIKSISMTQNDETRQENESYEEKITVFKLNKGFPLEDFLQSKKSQLFINQKDISKYTTELDEFKKINYDKEVMGVNLFTFPDSIENFIGEFNDEISYFYHLIRDTEYDIENCKTLIKDVEQKNKEEKSMDFFFKGFESIN